MSFDLRPGLHVCFVGSQAVFLDVDQDRYFCLRPEANAAFESLAFRRPLTGDDLLASAALVSQGVVCPSQHEGPGICAIDIVVPATELPSPDRKTNMLSMFWTLGHHIAAGRRLGARPLKSILARARQLKAKAREESAQARQIAVETAWAFQQVDRLASANGRCLQRSLAVMEALSERRCPATLVIGVRVNPFMAHSWVQAGGYVLTDSWANVRAYTPILAV